MGLIINKESNKDEMSNQVTSLLKEQAEVKSKLINEDLPDEQPDVESLEPMSVGSVIGLVVGLIVFGLIVWLMVKG